MGNIFDLYGFANTTLLQHNDGIAVDYVTLTSCGGVFTQTKRTLNNFLIYKHDKNTHTTAVKFSCPSQAIDRRSLMANESIY